jgi:hypothetical protein
VLAAALLAGCAAGRTGSQPVQTPEQQAWEQRIVNTPALVSSEYFRQREQPQPAIDAPAARRSQQDAAAKHKGLEERVTRLEGGAGASATPPGYIVRVNGRQLYTDLTAHDAGVAVGATLSILAERELVHPVTGRSLGSSLEEIGRATVVEIGERFSVAEIADLRAGEAVKPKDRVRIHRP